MRSMCGADAGCLATNHQSLWQVRTLAGHSDSVNSVGFSPDGKRVVSASWDDHVKFWDAQTGAEVRCFFYFTECTYCLVLESQHPHKIGNLLFTITN